MLIQSLWSTFSKHPGYPSLRTNGRSHVTDVAVIGGGITGITVAHLLSERGYDVTVLEAGKVGGGTTSHSTGNLYCTIDQNLSSLKSKYDDQLVREVVRARGEAIDLIEKNVRRYSLDCDFSRQFWYLYSGSSENDSRIENEFRIAQEAGMKALIASAGDFPFRISRGIKVPDQAQLNPLLYVQGLAKAASKPNLNIYEETHVDGIREKKDGVVVTTEGGKVTARFAVHATHTPKGKMVSFQSLLGPYREYGVAASLRTDSYPEGIYWGIHENSEKFSVRSYLRGETKVVLAIGQPHKVGQKPDNVQNIQTLEKFLSDRFDTDKIMYRWGGQHYRPARLIPYIGRKSENSRLFIATGFSTDGLVYGSLSGMIISDLISGRDNRYAGLFDPSRSRPVQSAGNFVKENVNVGLQYIRNLPTFRQSPEFNDIEKGTGRLVEKKGHKIAAYRRTDGTLELLSAVCSHMACIVQWNKAEKTWDCPCHASRFDTSGRVIEGPAFHPLEKIR